MKKKILHTIVVCLLANLGLNAQVTIGSGFAPAKGALLDLKQENRPDGSANSKLGLMLPRVLLTGNNLDAISTSANDNPYDYAGLIIYNVGSQGNMCPGIYVWNGNQWTAIGNSNVKTDITMTDKEGHVYNAKWFGSSPCDGAYWTTSNLYTAQKATGGAFSDGQPRLNPAHSSSFSSAIAIPHTGIESGEVIIYGEDVNEVNSKAKKRAMTREQFAKEFGLLYTHKQAMQACPNDWHLPNNSDWDNLAKYMGGTSTAARKMRKNQMHYYTTADGITLQWGPPTTSDTSGFDAVPAGKIREDGKASYRFGRYTNWWSSNTSGSYRSVIYNRHDLKISTDGVNEYNSIRCVHN